MLKIFSCLSETGKTFVNICVEYGKQLLTNSASHLQYLYNRWPDYITWMSSYSHQTPSPSGQTQALAGCRQGGSSCLVPSCTGFECRSSQSLDKVVQNPENRKKTNIFNNCNFWVETTRLGKVNSNHIGHTKSYLSGRTKQTSKTIKFSLYCVHLCTTSRQVTVVILLQSLKPPIQLLPR